MKLEIKQLRLGGKPVLRRDNEYTLCTIDNEDLQTFEKIVFAVNIHEELIEALGKAIDRLDSLIIDKLGNSVFDKELNDLKQLLKKANEK